MRRVLITTIIEELSILFIVAILLSLSFNNSIVLNLTSYPKLNIQYFNEIIHGSIVDRFISINGTNVTVSGFTYNINATWYHRNGTKVSFPAIWAEAPSYLPPNISSKFLLPVRDGIVGDVIIRGLDLIFAANYNGTYYKEAIIEGEATIVWGFDLYDVNSNSSVGYGVCRIRYEEKRTFEFVGANVSSKYNPSLAILNAIRFLNNQSLVFDNVTNIFLIPQEYLISEYKSHEFVWSMIFLHDLNSSEGADLELNHFIISPNATILKHTHLILKIAESVSPCHGCEPPEQYEQYDYSLYFYASIGSIMITAILIVVYTKIIKEKRKR